MHPTIFAQSNMLLKLNRLLSFTKSMKSLKSMQINASLLYCSEPRIIEPKNTLEEHLEKENQDMFRITGVSEMNEKVSEPDSRNDIENKSFHENYCLPRARGPRFGQRNNFRGPGKRSFVMFEQRNSMKEDNCSKNQSLTRQHQLQNEPQTACEKRREVQEEILNGRKKLREMLDILDKTSVGDDAKTSVVQQVGKLLGEQESLHFSFMLLVQDEREEMMRSVSKESYNMDREDHKISMDVGRLVPVACVALLILFVLA